MNRKQVPIMTIDGPSGVGKGTISRILAEKLGWHSLDSGAMYRVLAWAAHNSGLDLTDGNSVAALAPKLKVKFINDDSGLVKVFYDEEDVSTLIRTELVGGYASKIATHPAVRQALLSWQREAAIAPGLIAEGRDMGSVIFPDATVKIFLIASVEERAKRRFNQLRDKGHDVRIDQLIAEIAQRDERDQSREAAPLKPASDAHIIDTSFLSIDEVIAQVMANLRGLV